MTSFASLYNIIYALAALGKRERTLFGSSSAAAYQAFAHSLAGKDFPELWFELPLAGDPWFDLHVLTSRTSLDPSSDLSAIADVAKPAFAWFASQDSDCEPAKTVRQLALSWDTGTSMIARSGTQEPSADAAQAEPTQPQVLQPAIQLLVNTHDPEVTCDFLDSAGRPDAKGAYRAFAESLPDGWFPCYTGVFPERPAHNLRVECIPELEQQLAYADDAALLERHLRQVGLEGPLESIVERCQAMARTPFKLEFQFDVEPDGCAGATFGASVRFACPPREGDWEGFSSDGAGGELMSQVESWGLADDRWRHLDDMAFAKRATKGGESHVLFCYPAFCKLRWRDGKPLDAKAYVIAGVECCAAGQDGRAGAIS